ncbi:hypothetical protein HK104_009958 [Borealophlyctis nickersoniae]|nr:hypothetical protein HK104_009958 [Borealophlyctis nickersoniae]
MPEMESIDSATNDLHEKTPSQSDLAASFSPHALLEAFTPSNHRSILFYKSGNDDPASPLPGALLDIFLPNGPRALIFGEHHSQPDILKAQIGVLHAMASLRTPTSTLTLVLEMFNQTQQPMLDAYASGTIGLEELADQYEADGEEGFNIRTHYGTLLEDAKTLGVAVRGGFLPRSAARKCMGPDGEDAGIEYAHRMGWVDGARYMKGSEEHFKYFTSAITGEPFVPADSNGHEQVNESEGEGGESDPNEGLRRIFPAQVIKDNSMAHVICSTLEAAPTGDCRVLGICGSGHGEYGFGVPERVEARGFQRPAVITCRSWNGLVGPKPRRRLVSALDEGRGGLLDGNDSDAASGFGSMEAVKEKDWLASENEDDGELRDAVGKLHPRLADLLFVYDTIEDGEVRDSEGQAASSAASDAAYRHPGVARLDQDPLADGLDAGGFMDLQVGGDNSFEINQQEEDYGYQQLDDDVIENGDSHQ